MATLRDEKTGDKIFLRSLHAFGRNPVKADTVLANHDASQLHASIRWNGDAWELIDHSSNGTLLNGRRIANNVKLELVAGQTLQFAPGAQTQWTVLDLDPPCAMLVSMQAGTPDICLSHFHLLPNEVEPLASVSLAPEGLWLHETDSARQVLKEGDRVQVGSDIWKFTGSPEIEATVDLHHLHQRRHDDVLFQFKVSLNEEHISLSISDPAGEIDLGERTHHYGLLTLARRRLADAGRGLDQSSQGWIDIGQLSSMLGLEQNHLNMQIFRARSQVAKALPSVPNGSDIVERRRGEVRFGAFRFQIHRGTKVEGCFSPSELYV